MELKCSLLWPKEPITSPCSEPDESSLHCQPYVFKIHFNINFISIPRSPKWSFTFLICQISCAFLISPTCAASPTHPPDILLGILYSRDHISHLYKTWGRLTVLHILIFTFSDRRQKGFTTLGTEILMVIYFHTPAIKKLLRSNKTSIFGVTYAIIIHPYSFNIISKEKQFYSNFYL